MCEGIRVGVFVSKEQRKSLAQEKRRNKKREEDIMPPRCCVNEVEVSKLKIGLLEKK